MSYRHCETQACSACALRPTFCAQAWTQAAFCKFGFVGFGVGLVLGLVDGVGVGVGVVDATADGAALALGAAEADAAGSAELAAGAGSLDAGEGAGVDAGAAVCAAVAVAVAVAVGSEDAGPSSVSFGLQPRRLTPATSTHPQLNARALMSPAFARMKTQNLS